MPQLVVNIWKFSTSDITCLFSIPKYSWLQGFTKISLFVITLFIFGQLGYARGQLTLKDGMNFINFYFWYHKWIKYPYLKSGISTKLFQTTLFYSFRNILLSGVIRNLKWINLSIIMGIFFWGFVMFDRIFLSTTSEKKHDYY